MTSERLFNSFIPPKTFMPPKQISGYAPGVDQIMMCYRSFSLHVYNVKSWALSASVRAFWGCSDRTLRLSYTDGRTDPISINRTRTKKLRKLFFFTIQLSYNIILQELSSLFAFVVHRYQQNFIATCCNWKSMFRGTMTVRQTPHL